MDAIQIILLVMYVALGGLYFFTIFKGMTPQQRITVIARVVETAVRAAEQLAHTNDNFEKGDKLKFAWESAEKRLKLYGIAIDQGELADEIEATVNKLFPPKV